MLDKQDLRGSVLVIGILVGVAGIALLVGSWDLPAGVPLGRRGFTEVATEGDVSLRKYAILCFVSAGCLAVIHKMKGLWK